MRNAHTVTTRVLGAVAVAALLFPVGASAQQAGAIAGIVRDTTGGVLPGVTVEASSPALIEKVRVVTTDASGQYRIVDLRPGVYTMTFTLPGFSTVKRDGIELTAGFTATVSVELRVGAVAETITVSGASPVVDVQNVAQRSVITRNVIDTIPTGKQYTALVSLIPGVVTTAPGGPISQDVGGTTGMTHVNAQIHGGREEDGAPRINGMTVASITSQGNSRSNIQEGIVEEYNIQLGAAAAEFPYGGIYYNVIPKQGGRTYHGALFAGGTSEALHVDNLDEDLKRRGLAFQNKVKRIVDINPSFGGPVAEDRLWFHASARYFVTDSYVPGLYMNKDLRAWAYTPDVTERAVTDQTGTAASLNLTWQATPKNKLTMFSNYDFQCWCHYGISGSVSPEATHRMTGRNTLYQGMWSSPVSSRILLEAAASRYITGLPRGQRPEAVEPAIRDDGLGILFRSSTGYARNDAIMDHYRASLSYVTGAHAFKVGFDHERQFADDTDHNIGSISYRSLYGMPNQVTYYTLPYAWQANMNPLGIYVQDQWTLRRWTINAGFRYDQFTSSYPASHNPPNVYLPVARDYPGADVLNWKDVNPRLGVSWDLFGNGKTALKATLNRYIQQEGKTQTANVAHPVFAAANSISRTWRDLNGDFVVQGDPLNPAANGELGPSPNIAFGRPITTRQFDPDWANGFGTRPYNWETSLSVQHEVIPSLSVTAAYFRRTFGNFIVEDNVLVSPSDYDPYCITAPSDPRLPRGGGQQICGLYDLSPRKVGQVQFLRTYSDKHGDQYEYWQGVDLTMNARLPNAILLQGGMSTGKQMYDTCDIVTKLDNPSTYNCHQETPFLTQVKFLASYPLPGDVQLSGTYQHMRYDPTNTFRPSSSHVLGMRAFYVATNDEIAPSLGRNLSSGVGGRVTIDLLEANPGLYLDYVNQIDFRVAKTFRLGGTSLQGLLDVYNVFNANPVMKYNTAYGRTGASWLVPQAALPGRLIRFGAQVEF